MNVRLVRNRSAYLVLLMFLIPVIFWILWPGIALGDIWQVFSGLGVYQVTLLALINIGIILLFSLRWWLFARALGNPIPLFSLMRYRLTAFGINYFTPGPQFGGEPYQVYALRRYQGVPLGSAISAVTLDKLFELLANFTFLVIGIFFTLQVGLSPTLKPGLILALFMGLILIPGGYLLALRWNRMPVSWIFGRLKVYFPNKAGWVKLGRTLVSAESEVANLCQRKMSVLFIVFFLSLATWGFMVFEYWFSLRILGLSLALPETLALLTAARLAFLMPSPGGLGTLEASQWIVVQALGLSPIFGISISLLIRTRDVVMGLLGLTLGGLLISGNNPGRSALKVLTRLDKNWIGRRAIWRRFHD